MSNTELPPPYYALKEDATTEQNATEIPMPHDEEPLEAPIVYAPAFENKDTRIGFIQKVLAIKFFQAIAMTIVMVIFVVAPYSIYRALVYDTYTRINLIVVSSLILLATLGLLHYCNRSRFVLPYNYMFLGVYPLAVAFFISVVFFQSGLVSIFVSWVYFNIVLFALLMISVFALQTNIEFKTNVGLVITGLILIVTYAFTVPFIYGLNAFGVLYCSLMIFALTAYVLNDLQAMMSKTYRIHLSPADFVKAALIMHIDYRYMIMKFFKRHCNSTAREVNDVQN
ncbi:uncharacterized protein [Choristoneura fumiferana]|uniref:uncharacterized protein n=1 Tax=Choristoneura fumiferana TaxID=7141 RepID=UPI003D15DBB1